MADLIVPTENHERADNKLCQAQGIVDLLMSADSASNKVAVSHAAWAARELIEEARNLYGKF